MSVKRCNSAFTIWVDGVPRVIAGGDLIEDSDPIYKGHEHFFEDASGYVQRRAAGGDVEAATAEPGERREVTAPARRGRPPKNRNGGGA